MVYVCLVLLTLLFAGQTLFCRLYSASYQGKNPAAASEVYSIIFGLTIGLITFAMNGFGFAPSRTTVICGLLNAAMLYLFNTSLVRGGLTGSYGFLMICSLSGNMLLPVFWDAVFNGTPVTAVQLAALILLLISFVLMNLKGIGEKSKKGYYLWCAGIFLANGFYGVLINVQQQLSAGAQRTEMVVISYLVMALAALIVSLLRNRGDFIANFHMGKKALGLAALSCATATAASNILVYLITRAKSLTLVYAFNNGGVLVVSALLAAALFKEKLTPTRITGIVLSCAGIILLCL